MSCDDDSKILFLKSTFGTGPISRGGIAVNCPSCSKDNPAKKKLIIRILDGAHHCWVCDLKGRTLKYTLRKFFPKRIREYNNLYGDSLLQDSEEKQEVELPRVPSGFVLLAQNYHSRDPDIRDTISYTKKRGMTLRDLWRFKLGSCATGRFKRRLIIPSFDSSGDFNYFVARSIDGKMPKYINAKYPKRKLIFNEINIEWDSPLTLVEGPFDMFKAGNNATCILGSSLNEKYSLFQKIIQNRSSVSLALDPDAMLKTMKIAEKFHQYGIDVKIVDCSGYDDVGEMTTSEFTARKISAKLWKPADKLVHLIHKMRSGSII